SGCEVFLIAQHEKTEVVDGIQIIALPSSSYRIFRRLFSPWKALIEAFRLRADLYHFHDPELFPAMQALKLLRRVPIIWDAHEYYTSVIYFFNQFGWRPLSYLGSIAFEFYEILAIRFSFDGVVTITDQMANRYRSRKIPVAIVGNLVEMEELKLSTIPPPRSQPPRILNSGMLIRDHGLFEILEAFRRVRSSYPCELVFWGRFHDEPTRLVFEEAERAAQLGSAFKRESSFPRR